MHAKPMQPTPMITTHRSNLELRCTERGYTLDEVMPCVVSQEGDLWTIDPSHEAYPAVSRIPEPVPEPPSLHKPAKGPGTELKALLAGWPFRIKTTDTCPCNAMAHQMNTWGCDECEARVDEIVAHMRTQAATRGLPFIDAAGRMLVRRAIKNARKNQH